MAAHSGAVIAVGSRLLLSTSNVDGAFGAALLKGTDDFAGLVIDADSRTTLFMAQLAELQS